MSTLNWLEISKHYNKTYTLGLIFDTSHKAGLISVSVPAVKLNKKKTSNKKGFFFLGGCVKTSPLITVPFKPVMKKRAKFANKKLPKD